jgi:hypothetical protein
MLDELAIARADGRLVRLMASWARVDVLLIDDFLLRPLNPDQAADTLEVIEDRAGLRSTVITSQLPVNLWHEAMGEPTIADAVLDRLLAHLHRIELAGESMRRAEPTRSPTRRPPCPPRPSARGRDDDRQLPDGRGPGRAHTLGLLPERWVVEHWCNDCRRRLVADQLVAHAQHHEGLPRRPEADTMTAMATTPDPTEEVLRD